MEDNEGKEGDKKNKIFLENKDLTEKVKAEDDGNEERERTRAKQEKEGFRE